MSNPLSATAVSSARFIHLALLGYIRLKDDRVGKPYLISQHGPYAVFRETINRQAADDPPVTLVVGFRLKLLGVNPMLHWLFQRVCMLTTPFWSGFRGFGTKLWMVDPETKGYLGIYDWRGRKNAEHYANWLVRILQPISTKESVCYHIHDEELEDYLRDHEMKNIHLEHINKSSSTIKM